MRLATQSLKLASEATMKTVELLAMIVLLGCEHFNGKETCPVTRDLAPHQGLTST